MIGRSLGATLALAALAAAGAGAETGPWVSNGPPGASVYCIVPAPSSPSTVYVGTGRGVWRGRRGGTIWEPASGGLPADRTQAVAVDPTDASTLYAGTVTPSDGTPSHGIFKSQDGGASWIEASDGLVDPFTGIEPLDVAALSIDPSNPQVILAGTRFSEIFRSTDGGASWTPQTLAGAGLTLETTAFARDPGEPAARLRGLEPWSAALPERRRKLGILRKRRDLVLLRRRRPHRALDALRRQRDRLRRRQEPRRRARHGRGQRQPAAEHRREHRPFPGHPRRGRRSFRRRRVPDDAGQRHSSRASTAARSWNRGERRPERARPSLARVSARLPGDDPRRRQRRRSLPQHERSRHLVDFVVRPRRGARLDRRHEPRVSRRGVRLDLRRRLRQLRRRRELAPRERRAAARARRLARPALRREPPARGPGDALRGNARRGSLGEHGRRGDLEPERLGPHRRLRLGGHARSDRTR